MDLVNGHTCSCTAGFVGDNCEIQIPPGEIEIKDPATVEARNVATLAVTALNKERKKSGMSPLSLKKVISYKTQVVAGILSTLCIESDNGFLQLIWDDAKGTSEAPHLTSVLPFDKIYKWQQPSTASYRCTEWPAPYDPRPAADRESFFLEQSATNNINNIININNINKPGSESTTTKTTTTLLEEKGTQELPKHWDARFDHSRSEQCKGIITTPLNQGTCGSCYAFAAVGTASIRACFAGTDIGKEGLSVQDVLNW